MTLKRKLHRRLGLPYSYDTQYAPIRGFFGDKRFLSNFFLRPLSLYGKPRCRICLTHRATVALSIMTSLPALSRSAHVPIGVTDGIRTHDLRNHNPEL